MVPFESIHVFSGDIFRIYGHQPAPQVNGFDYYFSPLSIDLTLAGGIVDITSVELSTFGTNLGARVNWNAEVFVGANSFGLPVGQLIDTVVDPVLGYSRVAPTHAQWVIGAASDSGSYNYVASFDYASDAGAATPYLGFSDGSTIPGYGTPVGLYAQFFFWTADNLNSHVQFEEVRITIRGMTSIPEPSALAILLAMVSAALMYRVYRRTALFYG